MVGERRQAIWEWKTVLGEATPEWRAWAATGMAGVTNRVPMMRGD
jgi:hypothetical protein